MASYIFFTIQPIIFTGNKTNILDHSDDSLNDDDEKILLPIFKTSQLRILNRFRNYRIPASYSIRSNSISVNFNFLKHDYLPDGKRLHIIDAFKMLEKLVAKYSYDRATVFAQVI